ncbi:hypothetical protein FBU30_008695 [Linnemannia zychae]|nr:hypothetical protein FBU30_008695 [Linnemannia zychae]
MGSDRRTSARDLLTLSQKVSILLQRQSDRLLAEIEDANGSFTSEEEAQQSERCQQAIDLRRNVWETSKLLKSALDHVEEIDDEDEVRILREPMDTLQLHIKNALQMVSSSPDTKASTTSGVPFLSCTVATDPTTNPLPIPTGPTKPITGAVTPMGASSGLTGSLNRHPLGLFSTSPNFSAQTSFSSSKRLSSARLPSAFIAPRIDAESHTDSDTDIKDHTPRSVEQFDPLLVTPSNNSSGNKGSNKKENLHAAKSRPGIITGLSAVSLDEGPLSIATIVVPAPTKLASKNSRIDADLDSTAVSSSPSFASFSTHITSPLDMPLSPPANLPSKVSSDQSGPKPISTSETKASSQECKVSNSPEAVRGPQPVRRVPRGLFSSGVETSNGRISGVGSLLDSNNNYESNDLIHKSDTLDHSLGKTSVASMDHIATILAQESVEPPSRGRTPTRALSPGPLPATRTQSPQISSIPKSPTSPRLQRTQPRPSPIQTAPTSPTITQCPRNGTNTTGEEQMSQLAKDLERAMNPTPTEPAPQIYFLQGSGLLERIPNSMDDEQDDIYSEDSDRNDSQTGQESTAGGLSRGNGSLRRQKSGGKRRFRISRSRSRNRSRNRERNKPELVPIEIGCTSALASSEWPFDKAATLPPSQSSLSILQQQQIQRQRNAALLMADSSQQGVQRRSVSQTTSPPQQHGQISHIGPRLPFAESVIVSNPIRVGRGIGSFTVYNVSLTLCHPNEAKVSPPARKIHIRNKSRDNEISALALQNQHESSTQHTGHVDIQGSDDTTITKNFASSSMIAESQKSVIKDGVASIELSKPPSSKAALMMTRSLSFPELGDSAERLLMEMQSGRGSEEVPLGLDAAISRAMSAQQVTAAHGQGCVSPPLPTRVVTGFNPIVPSETMGASSPASSPPPRVIHVRKRYTDFVTLRAQLVEMFREPKKGGIRNAKKFFSKSSSQGNDINSVRRGGESNINGNGSFTGGQMISPLMSNDEDDEDLNDDENGADDSQFGLGSHSRVASVNSLSSTTSSNGSIIRGMPKLPPKKVVGKFRPAFIEKRRRELEYFLEWVVAHPIMGDSPVVVQWFLGPTASLTV